MVNFIENWIRFIAHDTSEKALTRVIKDQYVENLFELVPAIKKVNPINLVEIAMRAAQPFDADRYFSIQRNVDAFIVKARKLRIRTIGYHVGSIHCFGYQN